MFRLSKHYLNSSKLSFRLRKISTVKSSIHASKITGHSIPIIKADHVTITNGRIKLSSEPLTETKLDEQYYDTIQNHRFINAHPNRFLYEPLHDENICFKILKYTPMNIINIPENLITFDKLIPIIKEMDDIKRFKTFRNLLMKPNSDICVKTGKILAECLIACDIRYMRYIHPGYVSIKTYDKLFMEDSYNVRFMHKNITETYLDKIYLHQKEAFDLINIDKFKWLVVCGKTFTKYWGHSKWYGVCKRRNIFAIESEYDNINFNIDILCGDGIYFTSGDKIESLEQFYNCIPGEYRIHEVRFDHENTVMIESDGYYKADNLAYHIPLNL